MPKNRTPYEVRKARDPDYFTRTTKARRESLPERYLWLMAKGRARRAKRKFTITPEDVIIPKYCPVFGIKLKMSDGRVSDSSPTIDRINNKKGYVPGNIVVVSWKANRLKSNASLNELKLLVSFYGQKSRESASTKNQERPEK